MRSLVSKMQQSSFQKLLFWFLVILVAYLILVPLGVLVWYSFTDAPPGRGGSFTLENYIKTYSNPETYSWLLNSLIFSVGTCAVAFSVGFLFAWLVERTDVPLRSLFSTIIFVPIIMPGVLFAIAWQLLLSPRIGAFNRLFMTLFGLEQPPFDVYTLPAMIFLQGLLLTPLAFVLMSAALRNMDPALEEAATMSGAGTLAAAYHITLKMMRPAMTAVILMLIVRGLEAFEIPSVVGIPGGIFVLTTKIWLALSLVPKQYGVATSLAVLLVAITIGGMLVQQRLIAREEEYATITGKGYHPRRIRLGAWKYLALTLFVLYFAFTLAAPFLIMVWGSLQPYYSPPSLDRLPFLTAEAYAKVLAYPTVQLAVRNTAMLGVVTGGIVMLISALVSWYCVRSKIKGRKVLDVLAFVPYAVPGSVLGAALIWVYLTIPGPIYGTIWILLIAYVTHFLPDGTRITNNAILQIHRDLDESAQTCGATWWKVFRRIHLPLMAPALLYGAMYIGLLVTRQLSAAILLYAPKSTVLSVTIYQLWDAGQVADVSALGVMLVIALLAVVFLYQKLRDWATIK